MSTVLTMAALQSRSDLELQHLMRKAQYDLTCSLAGSEERRDALAGARTATGPWSRNMSSRARPRPMTAARSSSA